VLALALYFLLFSFEPGQTSVFPGADQKTRYGKAFKHLVGKEEVRKELEQRGIVAADLGSHSTRKGGYTYVCSGSTACPSIAAIVIRVGWSMPGAQDRYLRYEAAGDQYVGRTIAGLPPTSPDFATIGPHFVKRDDVVESAVRACFPQAPTQLQGILLHCLASAVYHYDFLRQSLPPTHRIFNTALFTQPSLLQQLGDRIKCGLASTADEVQPTGVPPHVSLMWRVERMEDKLETVIPAFNQVGKQVVVDLLHVIDERRIEVGNVTVGQVRIALWP
jgi:hypothetical protein